MIEVFVDWNCFQRGGIYRYFLEVLPRVANHPEVQINYLGNASAVVSPPKSAQATHHKKITPKGSWFPNGRLKTHLSKLRKQLDQAYWGYQIRKKGNAIFHPTHYSLPPTKGLKEVITIHDLTPELFPEHTQGKMFDELRRDKEISIQRAARILTNSYSTKKDLCEFYNVSPERVDATPLGVHESFFAHLNPQDLKSQLNILKLPSQFVLYVGAREQYKNFSTILAAMQIEPFELVVAGTPFTESELSEIKQQELKKRVHLVQSPEEGQLRMLYQAADCFVYPSLYEGFGLPVLEAMASGTPVAASDRGAIPEVGGDVAFYFDPLDPQAIARTIGDAYDLTQRRTRIENGIQRAREFDWEKTATQTIAAYQKAMA